MNDKLLAPTFLFRFAAPCRKTDLIWSPGGPKLTEAHTLPWFGELDGRRPIAALKLGWSEEGLGFSLRVSGKSQPIWCRDSRIEDSDGLQLWIDTRNTQNIHRAGRFCHRFAFLPSGSGRSLEEPTASLLAINRARESPREISRGAIRVRAELKPDGYLLEGAIAASALTGFAPAEQPRLGFTYRIHDRELGDQTFALGTEFPIEEDPSLWGTIELSDK